MPEGPITASSRRELILRHSAATSDSRPKKTSLGRRGFRQRRGRLGGSIGNVHIRDEPVTALADGLDVAGVVSVVAERLAQVGDAALQRVVRHELGLPHRVEQLVLGHHLAGTGGEAEQHVHRLELELHRAVASRQPVQTRLHEPVADEERLRRVECRLDLGGHGVGIVSPGRPAGNVP
jgi:hypothetical protein